MTNAFGVEPVGLDPGSTGASRSRERVGVNVTENITTVGKLARPILAGLPVATRAMIAEKSSRGRSRMRTSGQKPHRIHEDAAQAHRLSSGPRAARRGRRVWNRRHERSDDTGSPVPPPRSNSRRRVARRASPRQIDVFATGGHPTRTSRAQIRRAVEVCPPRRPPERRRGGRKRVAPRQQSSRAACALYGCWARSKQREEPSLGARGTLPRASPSPPGKRPT